jgi:aminopeptidase N
MINSSVAFRAMRRTPFAVALGATALLTACTPASAPPSAAPSSAAPGVDYTAWEAGRSTPVAEPMYPQRGNAGLDVLHYDLKLAWNPDTRLLKGVATLRIRPTRAANEVKLDFTNYTVETTTLNGTAVAGSVADEKLTVAVPVVADKPVTLQVTYSGKPNPVPMPSKRKDVGPLGLTVTEAGGLRTMQEPFGAFTWYPANDTPSDEALYDIAVTVPGGWAAVASGTPQPGDGYAYRSTVPVASYATTLAVGKYKKETITGPHDLPITLWYEPGPDDALVEPLKKSAKHLEWLEQRFGPYPFPSAGVVLIDATSAMETQQMITLGRQGAAPGKQQQAMVESILVHEYAHHWFGNAVTPAVWSDLWLSEGWATYVQNLWDKEAHKLSEKNLDDYLQKQDGLARKESGAPAKAAADNFAGHCVYVCAAAMLNNLHAELGDDAFFALGRAWVQDQRHTTQTRAAFIAFVNKQTGKDLTGRINDWLDADTTPK